MKSCCQEHMNKEPKKSPNKYLFIGAIIVITILLFVLNQNA